LVILAKKWTEELKSCEYAGEIVVHENELPVVAQQVREVLEYPFPPRISLDTSTCLLVLAINCMYYDHDEEGFWVHFCELLKVQNNPQTQNWLGEMSELLHYARFKGFHLPGKEVICAGNAFESGFAVLRGKHLSNTGGGGNLVPVPYSFRALCN